MVAVQNLKGEIIPLILVTIFPHVHLQVVYYSCVKFHKNSISSLVGVEFTMYMYVHVPPFRESISGIISPADVHEGIWLLSKI
jgi:hypothetical protein